MKFEKVSFKQFKNDLKGICEEENELNLVYDNIVLPKRATKNSAGYDFSTPIDIDINPGETKKIPSGIRAVGMPNNLFLSMYVRSSVGIKKDVLLSNSVAVIDSDYANADNEGHIWIALRNLGTETKHFSAGERISQGVFQVYFITDDDEANGKRTGGIGSTNK